MSTPFYPLESDEGFNDDLAYGAFTEPYPWNQEEVVVSGAYDRAVIQTINAAPKIPGVKINAFTRLAIKLDGETLAHRLGVTVNGSTDFESEKQLFSVLGSEGDCYDVYVCKGEEGHISFGVHRLIDNVMHAFDPRSEEGKKSVLISPAFANDKICVQTSILKGKTSLDVYSNFPITPNF